MSIDWFWSGIWFTPRGVAIVLPSLYLLYLLVIAAERKI
jgi:hypothetical protein